ncbi:MAG: metal-sulfur cluster assembly factor [Ginsengibacter sp.]|jgi:metal-sulfur cluster biosynthetic enzyme
MNEIITNDEDKCSDALTALLDVLDPEIGLNVVDLGLIYQIDFETSTQKIFCTMTLTTQFCPMGESISTGVTNALQSTFPNYHPEVTLTFDPPWNASKISPEGHEFLNR